MDVDRDVVRKAVPEYMINFSEVKLSMVNKVMVLVIRCCLGGIGELSEGNFNV